MRACAFHVREERFVCWDSACITVLYLPIALLR
jgi:hypothetical protein